ncbi:hypothetical protein [Mycetocola sp. 2940]|uniref:hypothetical protein n=1 Tax=Mycetocola sp. 2940 TaxID=3156452 RepID=UPI003394A01F
MTPLPDEQPLSRRQLREQQRTTETSSTPIETPSRRASTTSAVTGGEIFDGNPAPGEPELSTDEVAELEEAEAAGLPLTRRQARDLERVRTASLSVVTPALEEPETADAAASVPDAPRDGAEASVGGKGKKGTPAKQVSKKNPKRGQTPSSKLPSFVPSSAPATVAEPDVVDAELVPADVEDEAPSSSAPVVLPSLPSESAFGPAVTAQVAGKGDATPKLSSSFGQAVLAEDEGASAATVAQPFDQIIARGLEEAGNGVNTSSIILPSMPNSHPLTGPLSANGNVVITGSIDLPSGSTGANPDHFDRSDIDAMFDAEDETRPATAGTPVSASKAVSTHTATRDVITPPAPARSNRLLLILAITAGVLAVAVLSVIIVGIAAGAFQSR